MSGCQVGPKQPRFLFPEKNAAQAPQLRQFDFLLSNIYIYITQIFINSDTAVDQWKQGLHF